MLKSVEMDKSAETALAQLTAENVSLFFRFLETNNKTLAFHRCVIGSSGREPARFGESVCFLPQRINNGIWAAKNGTGRGEKRFSWHDSRLVMAGSLFQKSTLIAELQGQLVSANDERSRLTKDVSNSSGENDLLKAEAKEKSTMIASLQAKIAEVSPYRSFREIHV